MRLMKANVLLCVLKLSSMLFTNFGFYFGHHYGFRGSRRSGGKDCGKPTKPRAPPEAPVQTLRELTRSRIWRRGLPR